MNSVRQILEIDLVLDKIKYFIKTKKGLAIISNLDVFENREECEEELKRNQEMLSIFLKHNDLPIVSHIDIEDIVSKAKKGTIIDELTFNLIKEELSSTKDIIKYFDKIIEKPIVLKDKFESLFFDESLYNKINNIISIDNTVSDGASTKLRDTRKKLEKADREIRSTIAKLMVTYKDQLVGDNFVLRDGSYVLPISTSLKASVEGIVHDISDSGQTTFIEPSIIVSLENNKHILEIEEKEEVTRILKELTFYTIERSIKLINNNNIIGYLDFLSSKIKYCIKINGTIPILSHKQDIKLYMARHPLLDEKNVVANDFMLGDDKTLLLISGPNAGGKTIALKTVSILAYMAKMGLPIPAAENSSIGFFRKIYVDIGDSQSIENNLSTFSAHISILSVILKYISSKDLVVIDELGNGTDPKEGEALSMAVVEYLLNRKCLSLISSHYTLLKQFGLQSKNVLSASFIFDEKNIEPTFRIIYDVSGKSYGFAIAKKYGVSDPIIERAKKIYEDNYIDDSDRKLQLLEDKERSIYEKNELLNNRKREIDSEYSKLRNEKEKLDLRTQKLKEKKIEEFDNLLDSKIDEIDSIVDEFKKSDKKHSEDFIKKITKITLKNTKAEVININDYVNVKGLDIEGKVVRIDGKKINIVTRDGLSINVSYDQCERIGGPSKKGHILRNIDNEILNKKSLSSSINLIGYHIDEGLNALDKYLSDCYSRGFHVVKVIHGFGTGKLRSAIHSHLKTLKYVDSFKLGDNLDGGSGSTIVKLK